MLIGFEYLILFGKKVYIRFLKIDVVYYLQLLVKLITNSKIFKHAQLDIYGLKNSSRYTVMLRMPVVIWACDMSQNSSVLQCGVSQWWGLSMIIAFHVCHQ